MSACARALVYGSSWCRKWRVTWLADLIEKWKIPSKCRNARECTINSGTQRGSPSTKHLNPLPDAEREEGRSSSPPLLPPTP